MKKILPVILIIVAGIVIFGYYSQTGFIIGKPVIEITPSSYDFGDIPMEIVNHTFVVKNTGSSPLEIERVSTSCGCTSASIDSELILPNQHANLLVTFDPNAMEDIEGEVLRIIYIRSNDPDNPEVEVEITANVIVE